jgi:aryl-alcohol dehydrogenase-like predicted oxidoreductase
MARASFTQTFFAVTDTLTVLATKYTTNFHTGKGDEEIIVNYNGNGSKSLHTSIHASLDKLRTSYIDLVRVAIFFSIISRN